MLLRIGLLVTSLAFVLPLLLGCQETKWENWQFAKIEERRIDAPVTIASKPSGAAVTLDGQNLGFTPCTAKLNYTETAAVFERSYVETKGSEKKILQTQQDRRNTTLNPTAHTLRFSRPHYLEIAQAFDVPKTKQVDALLEPVQYDWELARTEADLPRSQELEISSKPLGAAVYLDGQPIGTTPLKKALGYAETEMVFTRRHIEEQQGPSPNISTEEKRERGGLTPRAYEFIFKRKDFLDARLLVTIPMAEPRLYVELLPPPDIHDIDTALEIIARKEYFPRIMETATQYAVPDFATGKPTLFTNCIGDDSKRTPVEYPYANAAPCEGSLDVYCQTICLPVKDLEDFGRLVADLQALAKKNEFVFHITNAKFSANFDTNVMEGAIEHVVRGRVRAGSVLYRVVYSPTATREATLELVPVTAGTFEVKVVLAPKQTDVYLLSIFNPPNNQFAPPLPVFMKLDVHSQQATEIGRGDFEKATGKVIPPELIRTLAPAREQAGEDSAMKH